MKLRTDQTEGERANLQGEDLQGANLQGADRRRADLQGAVGLVKSMGVEPGNYYWKRIDDGFKNNGYQFKIGLNKLNEKEIFNGDERIVCGYPGLHFASRSWCAVYYGKRPYEAKVRIPEGAKICEPWATNGKASADMIEIVQVFKDGKDVTKELRKKYGNPK